MADTETADPDLPPSLTRLTFHGPMSEARAARLVERLARTTPRTVLDIGCGRGELMLRILGAVPEASGLGLDTDEGDLARGRDHAQARGLADRVTFVRESGLGTARGPADLVLCLGASHALSDAQPPRHTAAALPTSATRRSGSRPTTAIRGPPSSGGNWTGTGRTGCAVTAAYSGWLTSPWSRSAPKTRAG
jgi:SAM-dependent methyltransferase